MKKLVFLFSAIAFLNVNAQVMKFHRVLMQGGDDLAIRLLELGITIDHSDRAEGGIVAEIGDDELATLKKNNIKHKVLIKDLASYYEERNKYEMTAKSAALPQDCNKPGIVKPTYFHLGSMGGYFTFAEMTQILDSMVLLYPNLITAKAPLTPLSVEGRTLWVVKISDNPNTDEAEPEVLYDALHHAREGASLSQLIFYMWYMLEHYATDPDIKATVDATEMFFVPCVNPDGYVYNQSTNPNGGGMWRKNRRDNLNATFGVDLNRNYGYNWGYDNVGSSPTSSSDTYRGPSLFSEPETQAMRNLCNSRTFVNCLNAHTYGNLLIYPWGYLPSIYTPDSATYVNWAVLLTRNSRFLYGTGDQTVQYVTNGDSDDWMYGEQGTKPKILAMTPEAGSQADGFWPASSRIIDICKNTFTQNYNLAKVAAKYAIARDAQDKFVQNSGYIKYKLQRLGLTAGGFTVSLASVGADFASFGAPKIYPALTQNQEVLDSISYIAGNGLNPGQAVKYLIGVDNGFHVYNDTIAKVYGSPLTLLYDPGSVVAANFTTGGTWGISTTKFVSPPGSITDSPAGNYSGSQSKTITTTGNFTLNNAVYAHFQYYTRFELEKDGDYTQILISTNNGGSWSQLCGKYETSPVSFGGTNPLYDGLQDGWVKEDFDLSSYIGQTVKFRFLFKTDAGFNLDGFYFDDLLLRLIPTSPPAGISQPVLFSENISLSPNPTSGSLRINNPDGVEVSGEIFNSLGQRVYNFDKTNVISSEIDLGSQASGIYFVKLVVDGNETIKKIVKE
jgi:carboxypeptidase T